MIFWGKEGGRTSRYQQSIKGSYGKLTANKGGGGWGSQKILQSLMG